MLDKDKILSIVSSELSQVYGGSEGNIPDLHESLNYYLGNPNGREAEGKSQVTSTDVADAIEWIMPQIMKSFTQNNDIVIFDPVHSGDEKQAELESQYVYEVLMKQNNGFVLIHQLVKDSLMQRNGVLKVYYADDTEQWTSSYTGISDEELTVLGAHPDAEIIEHTTYVDMAKSKMVADQHRMALQQFQQATMQGQQAQPPQEPPQPMLHDVKVMFTSEKGRIIIDPVPLEEFRVNSDHNSICLDKARFTAHIVQKTTSELLSEGYDEELISELPEAGFDVDREYRFSAQGEDIEYQHSSDDESLSMVEVSECYMLMDYNGDGIAELCKVTVAGGDSPSVVLSVEEIEEMPWVSTTAILMSHKWQGLSIFDRLKEIQDQKTSLWRNMFDNLYLQNNQRFAVVNGQVNMDDMLVSRPGGIVRVQRLDAIMPLVTPQLGTESYTMMNYLDQVKAGRSGVSAEGGAAPQNIGDRVGSQGVDRLMNAKEELVGLIIRVIAETGIKPLCVKIRDLSTRHMDSVVDFRFRNEWSKIQPSSWVDRTQCTVRVGTGTGNKQEQLQALTVVMGIQKEIQMMPDQVLTQQQEIYNAVDTYCKYSGLNGADGYFVDPSSPSGAQRTQQKQQESQQAKQKQDQMEAQMVKSQTDLAQAELQKAQAQQMNVQLKSQTDNAKNELQLQKQNYEAEIKGLETMLKESQLISDNMGKSAELDYKYADLNARTSLELTRIESEKEKQLNEEYTDNKESVSGE